MKVHNMMVELSKQVENPVFLDTVGNLRFRTNALYVLGLRKFVRTLLSLRSRRNFVLFIDSMSFLADKSVTNQQRIFNILWTLIYENDATVVVSNQYRTASTPGFVGFVPRLGRRWGTMVSYRIMFKYLGDSIVTEISSNDLFNVL